MAWLQWLWGLVKPYWPRRGAPVPSLPPDVPAPEARDYYLTGRQMARIKGRRTDYQQAVAMVFGTVNVETDWLILPPVHYAETGLSDKEQEPNCGPLALDRRDTTAGDVKAANEAFARQVCAKYHIPDATVSESFLVALLCACEELKAAAHGSNVCADTVITLPDAYWGYNGRGRFAVPPGTEPDPKGQTINRSWRYAAYVMNDPKRGVLLRQHGTLPGRNPGDPPIPIDNVSQNPGTLIVYRELLERRAELV